MSFMLTKEQMYNKTKTVTRRMGWKFLKAGDIIQAVEKCQGLKKGEKMKPICLIRIVSTKWEQLMDLQFEKNATTKEGFPDMSSRQFIGMFCKHHKMLDASDLVNRIEFEFI